MNHPLRAAVRAEEEEVEVSGLHPHLELTPSVLMVLENA